MQQVQSARGKFVDFTDVLWMDIVLNLAWIMMLVGLFSWIGWGYLERRHGVRGAVRRHDEKSGSLPGRRLRVRKVLVGLSVASALVLVGFGLGLNGRPGQEGEDAGLLLWTGVGALVVWLLGVVFLRPRAWSGPEADDPRKNSPEKSAEHVDPGGARSTHG
ncbi:hypothetical protein SAMN05421806_11166 [Streptomyces indicus]|uniref:Uncharacterized protein n=1 Tax=Streptomyces indicus TaxID=417292 RepID=A0A1G9EC45_9ACTN|nr:hypothetical protein SAMN05421806_11166 [Streptomyces indicus]